MFLKCTSVILDEHTFEKFFFPDFEQNTERTAAVTSFVLWFCFLLWYVCLAKVNVLVIFTL